MENVKQPKKKINPAWIAITVLLSLLILYTVYHVFGNKGGTVKTVPTGFTEQTSSVIAEGIIIRDERVITSQYSGDVRYLMPDGVRISADMSVAEVYSNKSDIELEKSIAELEEKLEILKKSNDVGVVSVTDIEKLDAEMGRLYSELMLAVSKGELARAGEIEKELLISLNKKKIYDGTVKNYKAEISALETEINKLYASFGGEKDTLSISEGGYFYHECDGYESTLTLDALSALDINTLKNKIIEIKEKPVIENDEVGKMVYDYKWRLASLCDESVAATLVEGDSYEITLFGERNVDVSMTLEKLGESDGESRLVIFSCNVMPDGFDFGRYQSFQIMISSIKGYRVPTAALQRVVDKVSGEEKVGVYVLNASVVYFRRVEILAECDGYYIVAECDKSRENYKEYLDLNDLMIVSGEGLYDGKIIER